MQKAFERAVSQNKRCFSCGSLVYAVEKRVTTRNVYHDRCFRCRICKRSLNGSSLDEDGDDIYCTNCFRKKQRGDCDSLNFKLAAAEKARYVYNEHNQNTKDQNFEPLAKLPIDFARRPSLTLRHLEQQYLSREKQTIKNRTRSVSPPSSTSRVELKFKPSFSTPINLPNFDTKISQTDRKSIISPALHFSPALSVSVISKNDDVKSPFPTNERKRLSSTSFFRTSSIRRSSATPVPSLGKVERRASLLYTIPEKSSVFVFPETPKSTKLSRSMSDNYYRTLPTRKFKYF